MMRIFHCCVSLLFFYETKQIKMMIPRTYGEKREKPQKVTMALCCSLLSLSALLSSAHFFSSSSSSREASVCVGSPDLGPKRKHHNTPKTTNKQTPSTTATNPRIVQYVVATLCNGCAQPAIARYTRYHRELIVSKVGNISVETFLLLSPCPRIE